MAGTNDYVIIKSLAAPGVKAVNLAETQPRTMYMVLGRYRQDSEQMKSTTPNTDDRRNPPRYPHVEYAPGSNTKERIKFIPKTGLDVPPLLELAVSNNDPCVYEFSDYTGFDRRLVYDLMAGYETKDQGFEVYAITIIEMSYSELVSRLKSLIKPYEHRACKASSEEKIFGHLTDEYGRKGCVKPGCDILLGDIMELLVTVEIRLGRSKSYSFEPSGPAQEWFKGAPVTSKLLGWSS